MAYECILLKAAQQFLDGHLSPDERKNIVGILEGISNAPLVDGITKFYFPAPPAIFTLCKEEKWWILYYSPRANVLHIINIGQVPERVSVYRTP